MRTPCTLLILTLLALTGVAQSPSQAKVRSEFVKAAIERMRNDLPGEHRRRITERSAGWEISQSEEDWIKLSEAIHAAAKLAKAQCEVEISASRGSDATVKYQTLGSRKRGEPPTTAKDLTKLTETMLVGTYHIWSERSGSATSDKDAQFHIVKKDDKVKLEETK